MGCELLKCAYQFNHSDYYESSVNAQYSEHNSLLYKLAAQQKDTGITAADRFKRASWSSLAMGLVSGVYGLAESLTILATGKNFNGEDESRWAAALGATTVGLSQSGGKLYRLTKVDEVGAMLI